MSAPAEAAGGGAVPAGGAGGGVMRPALSRSTVDRAAARRRDPAWLAQAWRTRGAVLRLDGALSVPVAAGPVLVYERAEGTSPPADAYFLGDDGESAYFAVVDGPARAATDGPGRPPRPLPGPGDPPALLGLREVGVALPARDAGLLVHAVALANWHRTHTHCPRDGTPTVVEAGGAVRRCPTDGSEHFPRTDPAMIVLVTDEVGERAVLGRGAQWPPGFFSCLAGFVEAGESVEQAVVREVGEEVGLAVGSVRYVDSQPWPFPASLMLGFTAVAAHGPLVLEEEEMAEARWFGRAELRAALADGSVWLPPHVSIARLLIDGWLGVTGLRLSVP